MKVTGKRLYLYVLALLLLCSSAQAALEAQIDRHQVALGDTLRLVISATGNEDLGRIELSELEQDFSILQRSNNSSISIINGRRSQTRQLILDLSAKRVGTLQIPALSSGSARTNAISVEVSEPPELPGGDQAVVFEAEVDRESVYVQGQVLLTLRIQQLINLDSRSVTELKLDNAFVKELEQQSFQRNVNGRPWLVHEIRYAIFPEQSGTLEIPAQTFSAREALPQRSMFDRAQGRLVRRNSEALRIDVLPRPEDFPAQATWLPAKDLKIIERWSTPPEQLSVGESTTRSIQLVAEGLQGAQLPPILFPSTAGLKYYPDQPEIMESELSTGLVGQRQDSAALVPTAAGNYHIPEIRIPWWDTEAGILREAVLAGRDISVSAAEGLSESSADRPDSLPVADPTVAIKTVAGGSAPASNQLLFWQALAISSSIGWLATLLWLWRSSKAKRVSPAQSLTRSASPANESSSYKKVLAACAANQAEKTRQALLLWAQHLHPQGPAPASLEEFAAHCGDHDFSNEIDRLNRQLYASDSSQWQGQDLATCVTALRKKIRGKSAAPAEQLSLYPSSGA